MKFTFFKKPKKALFLSAIALSTSVVVSLARLSGILQYSEWLIWDAFFCLKPNEAIDERIVIVGMTEEDLKFLESIRLSDLQMASLLTTINKGKPRAIGVDIFRDFPVPPSYKELQEMYSQGQPIFETNAPGYDELIQVFRENRHILAIGKQSGIEGDPDFDTIAPPPIAKEQITDVSVIEDGDGILRRGFLYPVTDRRPAIPSLGLAVAFKFLETEGIVGTGGGKDNLWLSLNQVVFYPFRNLTGPYTKAGDKSYQILMNWRKSSFEVIPVRDILQGTVDVQKFTDKIVLIGGYAPSLKDKFSTPLSRNLIDTPRELFGVEIQAQLASQIISAALDGRPLISVLGEPFITIVTFIFTFVVLMLVYNRPWQKVLLVLIIGLFGWIGIGFGLFIYGYWIPILPPLLSVFLSYIFTIGLEITQLKRMRLQLIKKFRASQDEYFSYSNFNEISVALANRLEPYIQSIRTNLIALKKYSSYLGENHILKSNEEEKIKSLMLIEHYLLEIQSSLEMSFLLINRYFSNLSFLINPYHDLSEDQFKNNSLQERVEWALWLIKPIIFQSYSVDLKTLINVQCTLEINQKLKIEELTCFFLKILDEAIASLVANPNFDVKTTQPKIIEIESTQEQTLLLTINNSYKIDKLNYQSVQSLVNQHGFKVIKLEHDNCIIWCLNFQE